MEQFWSRNSSGTFSPSLFFNMIQRLTIHALEEPPILWEEESTWASLNSKQWWFFRYRWVIYIDWMPEGQTVNQVYYKNVLKTVHEFVQWRRPDSWKNASWILHQDNVPANNVLSAGHYLAKNNIPVIGYHSSVSFSSWKSSLYLKEPGSSPWMQWMQKQRSSYTWFTSNSGNGKTNRHMWMKLCVTVEGNPHANAPSSSLLSKWSEMSKKNQSYIFIATLCNYMRLTLSMLVCINIWW